MGMGAGCTRSIRAFSPSRSPGSPTTRRQGDLLRHHLHPDHCGHRRQSAARQILRGADRSGASAGHPNLIAYEDFIEGHSAEAKWGGFDENTAAGLCYTSGTTGEPKGVLYSHRSNVLHAMAANQTDCGAGANDVVLPVVPMFHANAWAGVRGADVRRQDGDAGPSSTGKAFTSCLRGESHLHRRSADGVAHAAELHAGK